MLPLQCLEMHKHSIETDKNLFRRLVKPYLEVLENILDEDPPDDSSEEQDSNIGEGEELGEDSDNEREEDESLWMVKALKRVIVKSNTLIN